MLLTAAGLIFVIACSNVANLILARSVRREGELSIRAALGASAGALRRTLLAESLVLCGAGAIVGVIIARPMVAVLARYASRFSVRALDLTVDASLLWVGASLALVSAVLLAFVPRLPSAEASGGLGLSNGSVRMTSGTNRRLRLFAVTQIAASFVLLAGAGTLLTTLFALQRTHAGMNTRNVLALHVPLNYERPPELTLPFYKEIVRRIGELPGVERVAIGTLVPWREADAWFDAQFTAEGYAKADGEDDPRARFRTVSPGFFAALGVPIIAGRDFNADDRADSEKVVIVSQSLAQRMFPNQDAVNRRFLWTDPVMAFIDVSTAPRRIVGVVADIDDENVVPGPAIVGVSPDGSGDRRRPALRTRADGSVRAGSADHEDHPRPVGGATRGAGRDARGCARGSSCTESVERARLRRVRRRRLDHCGGRRGRSARVFGQRAHARVWRPAGDRIDADRPVDGRSREGALIAAVGTAAGVAGGLVLARVLGGYLPDLRTPGAATLAASRWSAGGRRGSRVDDAGRARRPR